MEVWIWIQRICGEKKKVSAPCFPKPDDGTFSVEFSADGICFEFYAQKKMWALEAFVEGEWHPSAIHFVESELSSAEIVATCTIRVPDRQTTPNFVSD